MMAAPESRLRILIGAGCFADARGALQLAARVADTFAAELGGILVEESFLADIANLPKQRVITSSGTSIVAPSQRKIRAVLESDAKAFRETLSAVADARKWSFERRRGELISRLCEAAKGWDLLLLGHREMHRLTGQVILIAPPVGASREAENLAYRLARALRTRVTTLSLREPETPQPSPEFLRNEIALFARIGRIHASAVVVDLSAGPLRTFDQLRQLHAAARCPVLVLRAAQAEAALDRGTETPPELEDRF